VNVLLVRCDGVGDALACAPLVAALRDAGCRISAVLGEGNREIFAARTFVRVHVLERIPWPAHGSTPASRELALAEARDAGYDLALIASEEPDAYTFAREAGIVRRVGFANGLEKPLKTLQISTLLTRVVLRPASAERVREHEVETLFRLGRGLHKEAAPTRDPTRLAPLVLDEAAVPHRHVVVHVSRKLESDGLDRNAYVSIAWNLVSAGRRVLAVGDDAALVRDVARAAGAEAEPSLDMRAWKAAIGGALALVAPDSGASHVAGVVGVPGVDCFAPRASTARDVLRWRPWASRHRVVVLDPVRARAATGADIAAAVEDVLAPAKVR